MHAVARSGLLLGLVLVMLAPSGETRAVPAVVSSRAASDTLDERAAAFAGERAVTGMTQLVGKPAPDFSLPSLRPGNDVIQLSDHLGKVVYLDFWSSWCGPCRQAMPRLDRLRRQLPRDDFEVVGVNVDPLTADGRRFLEQVPVSYPIAVDPAGRAAGRFGVSALPALFVIDRDGVVRQALLGSAAKAGDVLEATAQELIGEPKVQ